MTASIDSGPRTMASRSGMHSYGRRPLSTTSGSFTARIFRTAASSMVFSLSTLEARKTRCLSLCAASIRERTSSSFNRWFRGWAMEQKLSPWLKNSGRRFRFPLPRGLLGD